MDCPYCEKELPYNMTGNIKRFEFTEYVSIGKWLMLREGLPDNHSESIPSIYQRKYGECLPLDWREEL